MPSSASSRYALDLDLCILGTVTHGPMAHLSARKGALIEVLGIGIGFGIAIVTFLFDINLDTVTGPDSLLVQDEFRYKFTD